MKVLLLLITLAVASRAALMDEPVDDRRLQKELLKFGEEQMDAGKATKIDALKAQLNRRRCQVALLPVSLKSEPLPDAASRVRHGVAVVGSLYKCDKCSKWHLTAASGFFISDDGILVTNHHVISDGKKEALVVMSGDGRMTAVAEVLASDPVADIAILRCQGAGFPSLPLSGETAAGGAVGVWSHPANHFYCLSAGIVSRRFLLQKPGGACEALAITADYARGSSGGPVFDDRGNVVGMVSSTDSVYYTEENGQQKNLQMVFKNCVSARSILALIEPKPAK